VALVGLLNVIKRIKRMYNYINDCPHCGIQHSQTKGFKKQKRQIACVVLEMLKECGVKNSFVKCVENKLNGAIESLIVDVRKELLPKTAYKEVSKIHASAIIAAIETIARKNK
jgi:hypothetical protein